MSDERNPFAGNGQGAPPSGANSGALPPDGRPVAPPDQMPPAMTSRLQDPDAKAPSIEDIISAVGANLPQRANGSQSTRDPASIRPGGPVDLRPPGKASTVAASAVVPQNDRPFKNLR